MDIRPYREADEASVVALWTRVFGYAQPHNDPLQVIRHKCAVQQELFFVAILDSVLVGTLMAGYDGHRGWIYSLAVSPDARRHGIGTALMKHAETVLARRDCPKINLQILATNAAVVAFYQKLGYAVEERVSMGKIMAPAAAGRGL